MTIYLTLQDFTPTLEDDVLISILSKHAKDIYKGVKRVEFRKVMPRIVPRRIFLYESQGIKAITGHIVISRALSGSPDELWRAVRGKSNARASFNRYFSDKETGAAFEIQRAVRYAHPVDIDLVKRIEPGFRVPQNFLYLQNLPRLKKSLREQCIAESFAGRVGQITVRPLTDNSHGAFIRNVKEHIGKSYLETGAMYGRKLLRIHGEQSDEDGILTTGKRIYEIMCGEDHCGFTVLTEKLGGSLKTGPTILFPRFRDHGIGKHVRKFIQEAATRAGFRKLYCTIPSVHDIGRSYLVSSGYRLEAHLERQYHEKHDELVFGLPLLGVRARSPEVIRQIVPIVEYERLENQSLEVANLLNDEFRASFCWVPDDWASAQMYRAIRRQQRTKGEFKPRRLYVARGLGVLAVGLCVFKRGGACKITLVSRTGHQKGLTGFVRFIEKQVLRWRGMRIRKCYTHVPVCDRDLLVAFYESGFRAEGILERPYNDNSDLVVLGKLL